MAGLTLRGIRKRYDAAAEVIRGVDLDIADGEFMVFVGPSGCGKSTMMRLIAGLEDLSAGELRIGDVLANDVPPARRGVAMVFQSYALYPHMTVAQNMGFSLKMAGVPPERAREQVERAAKILQIEPLLGRKPKALSGGQRQRVAIGRAIVRQPGVFLFDEPLSNLDAALRVQMRVELVKLHRELGSTMVYVTHDQTEAMTMGHRIAVFNAGRIEQVGAPMDLYERPVNRFVASFLGSPRMNLLPAGIEARADGHALRAPGLPALPVVLPEGLDTAACAEAGVRPEALALVPQGGWPLPIELVERLGDTTLLYLAVPGADQPWCLKLAAAGTHHRAGETVHVAPMPGALHLFDLAGTRLAAC